MTTAYDDDLTPEEQKLLDEHGANGELPPAEDDDNAAAPPADAPSADPAPAAAPAATPDATAHPDSDEFKAWLEKHKDKSPEELQRLAFDQSKRASKEGFQARQTREQLNTLVEMAQTRAKQRREAVEDKRKKFDEDLATDPDEATRRLHNERLDAELRDIEAEEFRARQTAAIELASSAIPNLREVAPEIQAFGREMGYTEDELANISDGRDLVTLRLANLAGNLMRAGMIDINGKLLQQAAQPIAATDPRLKIPDNAPKTLSSVPGTSGGGGKSIEQSMRDMMSLSDEAFDKWSNSPEFLNLMKQAN